MNERVSPKTHLFICLALNLLAGFVMFTRSDLMVGACLIYAGLCKFETYRYALELGKRNGKL